MPEVNIRKAYRREYNTWTDMMSRCNNRRHRAFKYYGGRGISVCERWQRSFPSFLHDMGPRPTPGHSLDRYPNKDGNYEPGNCRWATWVEQAGNRRPRPSLSIEKYGPVVLQLRCDGQTLAAIGRTLNVTRQRAHQIYQAFSGDGPLAPRPASDNASTEV